MIDRPLRILLLEDDRDDILLIRKMFEEAGSNNTLVCAETLSGGLEVLSREEIDIILLDLGLPDSSGINTLEKIVEYHRKIPIVVVTSSDNENLGILSLKTGAQDYLIKGYINSHWLSHSIRYAFEREQMMRKLDETRTEYVTLITHDLKVPLASIFAYVELLTEKLPPDGESREYAQAIYHSCNIMHALIENIVSVSMAETGQMRYLFGNFSFNELLAKLKGIFYAHTQARGITLNFSCPPDVFVYADKLRIYQVFHNLLSNALYYTPRDGTISIIATPFKEMINIEVSDTGRGIPKEDQEKVFEKFIKASDAKSGTGLGLYIVKNILKGHGFDISLQSEKGKGSKFFFSLKKGSLEKNGATKGDFYEFFPTPA